MAAVDTTKATAKASVKLTGDARAALLAINAHYGVPVLRLVDRAFHAGLASVLAEYPAAGIGGTRTKKGDGR